MAKFTAHTAVHGDSGTEFFAPGDTVPEWAVGKVGSHVTDEDSSPADAEPTAPATDDDNPEIGAAPDFTAPRQTRQRRK